MNQTSLFERFARSAESEKFYLFRTQKREHNIVIEVKKDDNRKTPDPNYVWLL